MKGAGKYGRHNWRKGQSLARAERSLERHLAAYMNGERDEDHLAALVFNAFLIQDHEARIASGQLPANLDDRDEWRKPLPVMRVHSHEGGSAVVSGTDVLAWS
jgi:proteasome lid subunit RPN8/RPN11